MGLFSWPEKEHAINTHFRDEDCAQRAKTFREMSRNPVFNRASQRKYAAQAEEWDRKGGKR